MSNIKYIINYKSITSSLDQHVAFLVEAVLQCKQVDILISKKQALQILYHIV